MWPNWRKPHWGPKHYQILVSQKTAKEFILPGSIFAIAADRKSTDTIWFVYIVDVKEVIDQKLESYGHAKPPCHMFVRARYLDWKNGGHQERAKGETDVEELFLYKESIVYPLVNIEQKKDHYFI